LLPQGELRVNHWPPVFPPFPAAFFLFVTNRPWPGRGLTTKQENSMVDFNDDVHIDVTKHEGGDEDWAGTGRYLSIEAPSIPINSSLSDAEIVQVVRSMLKDICGSAHFYQE